MRKSSAIIYWACVIAIQAAGMAMDFLGGNLDDPIRLLGLLFLFPGLLFAQQWMIKHVTTHSQYEAMLSVAVIINLGLAALVHFLISKIRVRNHREQQGNV